MKVSIITRHAIANYGSLLQSLATIKIFNKLGYDSEIIDYIREDENEKNLVKTYANNSKFFSKNIITRFIYKIIQSPNLNKMNKTFSKFRKKYLKVTEYKYCSYEELVNRCPDSDVYCTGSDQVWGQIGNDAFDKSYFLSFVNNNKKCIAYSASFGKSKISQHLKDSLPDLMKKYSSIMVREKTAIDLLNEVGIEGSKLVLDPTLILSKEEWEQFVINDFKHKEDYILIYQLHHNKNFDKYAKKLSKKTGLKIIRISPSYYFKFKVGKLAYLPNIEEFLTYFHNAKYVLTDSFHGTVFSIIFNKPMIDILPGKTGTRIESILELFNIQGRIVRDYNNLEIINNEIDFEYVNKKLNTEREKSISLLRSALED